MISVTGKLNKDAKSFQAGDSTGFSIGLGVQFYNRDTKEREWTNYRGVVFAKGGQVQFYEDVLKAGSIIELTGQQLQIKEYNDNHYLELIECKLGFVHASQQTQKQGFNQKTPPPQQQQGQFQKPEQDELKQDKPESGFDDFDDDIPF